MKTFHEITQEYIYKVTNLFSTEIDNRGLRRYFTIIKIISILLPVGFLLYAGISIMTQNITFNEFIGAKPEMVLFFLFSMIYILVAYEIKTIELHFVDGKTTKAVTNLVLMIVSQIILLNILYILAFGIILYKSSKVYHFKIKDFINLKLIPISGKLPIVIMLLNIFILVQATNLG